MAWASSAGSNCERAHRLVNGSPRLGSTAQPRIQAGQASATASSAQPSTCENEMGSNTPWVGSKVGSEPELTGPAKARQSIETIVAMPNLAYRFGKDKSTMWLILLEAGIALALLIGLVVWTMYGKK